MTDMLRWRAALARLGAPPETLAHGGCPGLTWAVRRASVAAVAGTVR